VAYYDQSRILKENYYEKPLHTEHLAHIL